MPAPRRTVIVHTVHSGRMLRTEAARANAVGLQIMTMGQLGARLAGGLLRPIDPEALFETVAAVLPELDMGELEPIKDLPGMPAAVVATFDKVWRAGVDLSAVGHPRSDALAALEEEVVRRLPASMKRPSELVVLAIERIGHAATAIGPLEIYSHSEMSPCWRPLLGELTKVIPVTWVAGPAICRHGARDRGHDRRDRRHSAGPDGVLLRQPAARSRRGIPVGPPAAGRRRPGV
ncbi:MAG: hypothetical protein EWM45_11915 [Rhodopseudomonas palustris]|nr:MAG: hypothetical protein EWM45_11915 [Rhodopseudomonas palustris]